MYEVSFRITSYYVKIYYVIKSYLAGCIDYFEVPRHGENETAKEKTYLLADANYLEDCQSSSDYQPPSRPPP